MHPLLRDLTEAMEVNHTVNLRIFDFLSDEQRDFTTSPRGGNTPAKQFAHMHNVRASHLADKIDVSLARISLRDMPAHREIRVLMQQSKSGIDSLIQHACSGNGSVKGFKRGIGVFITYLIAHEAHHRGKMLHILREGGVKLPVDISHGIWDWGRL